MLAAQESSHGAGLVQSDLGADKIPGLLEVGLGSSHLEIVHIDDQEMPSLGWV